MKQYVIRYKDERFKGFSYWIGDVTLLSYTSTLADAKKMGRYEARQAKRQLNAATKIWGRKHEIEELTS